MKDVAFSCDDNGAKFLRVTVWSLLKHYRGSEPLRINVFEGFGGHSAENKRKLQEVVDRFNEVKVKGEGEQRSDNFHCPPPPTFCFLRYHDVEKAIEPYADLIMNREKSRWNVFTWTPIFTPMLLEDATGNVAHFDIDMLFNDDVSKILGLDLGDDLIAAVAEYGKGDPVITEAVWGKGILPPEAERYFNTGTIVFNTTMCREERTWEKILAWYRDHYDIADRIEQDAWNALYWKRTKLLPLRWNFHDRLIKSYVKWDQSAKYWQGNPPHECLEAALNPAILHFWGPKKPWKPCHRPYRKLYHEAMLAVGQVPPKEPLLSCWHDCINRLALARVRRKSVELADSPARFVGTEVGIGRVRVDTHNPKTVDGFNTIVFRRAVEQTLRRLEASSVVDGRGNPTPGGVALGGKDVRYTKEEKKSLIRFVIDRSRLQYGKVQNFDFGEFEINSAFTAEVQRHAFATRREIEAVSSARAVAEQMVHLAASPNEEIGGKRALKFFEYGLAKLRLSDGLYLVMGEVGIGVHRRPYYDQHVVAKLKADSEVTSLQGQPRIGESAFDCIYDNRFRMILQGVDLFVRGA